MRKIALAFVAVMAATPAAANDPAVSNSLQVAQLRGPSVIPAPRVAAPDERRPQRHSAQRRPQHAQWDNEVSAPAVAEEPEQAPQLQQVQYYPQQPHPYERPQYYQQQQYPQQQPQYYAPQARPNLGGGLIEFLVTGNNAQQQQEPQAQQYYYPPQQQQYQRQPMHYRRQAPVYQQQDQQPQQRIARTDPQQQPPRQNRFDPRFERMEVAYETKEPVGSIVIDTRTRYLYLVLGNGRALRYGVGVGRPGFSWKGVKTVSAKKEWPDWRPPAEMRLRQPYLPVHMPGGPNNPLGARALYLGSSLYRIHGSNEPHTIGSAVSSGCFRMRNQDVIDLYNRVKVGARVVVL